MSQLEIFSVVTQTVMGGFRCFSILSGRSDDFFFHPVELEWLAELNGAVLFVSKMRLLSIFIFLVLFFRGATYAAERDSVLLERILERYTETMGGTREVDALASISIEGLQIQHGKSYDFLLRKKRPDSIRFGLSTAESSIVCGYNGRVGWQRSVNTTREVEVIALTGDQISTLRDEASFESPLFRHLEKSMNQFNVTGNEAIGEEMTYVLELREYGELTARYYLEIRSSRILKRELIDAAGAVTLETLYRDYRQVDTYWFAFEVENRSGGKQVSLIQIESILINSGLLNFYFEMPGV
jgi:hypothetical protein